MVTTRHIAEIHEATILQPSSGTRTCLLPSLSLSLSIAPSLNVHKRQLCKPRVFHKSSLLTIKQKCRSLPSKSVISIDLSFASIEFSNYELINAGLKISRLILVYIMHINVHNLHSLFYIRIYFYVIVRVHLYSVTMGL